MAPTVFHTSTCTLRFNQSSLCEKATSNGIGGRPELCVTFEVSLFSQDFLKSACLGGT